MERWFAERSVGDLLPGDHAWLAYSAPDEQHHVIGSFLRRGLLTSDMVVCVTDAAPRDLPGLRGLDLDARVRNGQLSVLSRADACLTRGVFDPGRMAASVENALVRAERERFRGLRIMADMTWAVRERRDRVLACEERVEAAIAPSTMAMAICQVDRRTCSDAELTALGDRHDVLVAVDPCFDDGVLSITRTYRPRGLRLTGELDRPRHAVFAEALRAVARSPWSSEVHLDLSGLRSVDLGALSIMSGAWLDMRPHGRLVLDAPAPRLAEVVALVGTGVLPGLELGVAAVVSRP